MGNLFPLYLSKNKRDLWTKPQKCSENWQDFVKCVYNKVVDITLFYMLVTSGHSDMGQNALRDCCPKYDQSKTQEGQQKMNLSKTKERFHFT